MSGCGNGAKPDALVASVGERVRWTGARWSLWQMSKDALRGRRAQLVEHTPPWLHRLVAPIVLRLDMIFVDHGLFRLVYLNRHRLGGRAWRSAQPAPHHIRSFARQGVRTIVNLRGERMCGSYWLERAVCERHGITLVNFKVRSRAAPTAAQVHAARELFERIEYPILIHCKSGADRVGLMSALYRILGEGVPVAEAKQELSWRYGHFSQADTGILDRFFELYLEYDRRHPMPFLEWVDNVYDSDELRRSFRASGWARRLVDNVLRRE